MEFRILKAGRPAAAAAGFALFLTGCMAAPLFAQQSSPQAGAAQQGQQAKHYKDRAEYELYLKITKTTDPQQRLQLLNTWKDKYPTSDFKDARLKYFVHTLGALAQKDPSQREALMEKCEALLKLDPNDFYSNYYIALYGPQTKGTPSPELVQQVQTSATALEKLAPTVFAPSKKGNVSAAQWEKEKVQVQAIGYNAMAWAALQNKNSAEAESHYQKSLQVNPDQGTISALYAKLLYSQKKFPEALFEYARAAQYSGPGPALPANSRTQLMNFFNKAYSDYHGSDDGASQVLAQAKTNALPPSGFDIVSATEIANKKAATLNARIQSDPAFKIWYSIKQSLQSQGDTYFAASVKGVDVPGGAEGVNNFTGTVISADPNQVTVGVENPKVADATLTFTKPLSQDELSKIQVGNQVQFSGVVDAYTANPYMLTFKDPTIPGVVTNKTTAPKRGARHRR